MSALRRYRLSGLLFCLCLSAVLLFQQPATSTQPNNIPSSPTTVTGDTLITEQPSDLPPTDTSLSLTQDVRKTVLENGLTVLTKEVSTAPVVSVQVWYKIGSRDEAPGVNGIAHQLEHMLFKGTTDRPIQFGRLFSALGSRSNAFTSYDQTAYFGTVERDKLRAMLELEADRMQNALIDPNELESEKRVVISELQGNENNPAYRLSRAVRRVAFPAHPYGLTVGGTKADVETFTLEQVLHYYRNYYNPNNATLVIVGDFETEPTLAEVQELFGKIPNQESKVERVPDINLTRSTPASPVVLEEPGSAALLLAMYPLPNINHPDVPALDLMSYILTRGRSSRLYQALVETGLTTNISSGAANLVSGGWFQVFATAAPGKELETIDREIVQTIATLKNNGVTSEELNRAKAQLQSGSILGLRDITSQARQLGNDQITAGDYRFTDRYLAAMQQVTVDDVRRVAQTYIREPNRTVGFFKPTQRVASSATGGMNSTQATDHLNLNAPFDAAEVAKYLPAIDSNPTATTQSLPTEFNLGNNLKVLLLPDSSTPTVTLSGHIQAGTEFDSQSLAGLATLTAGNMMSGTTTKDALTLAKILADRGASLGLSANREGVSVNGYALTADLPTLIGVLGDVLQNPTFPTRELDISRQQALTALKVELDTPAALGRRTFQQAIYPENHPFHSFPTEASLRQIDRDNVIRFYQQHYQPSTTVLTLVGNFDPVKTRSLLETELGSWKAAGKAPTLQYPSVNLPENLVQLQAPLPDKTQSVTYLGYKGINRTDPRYYTALVLNDIVGGSTLSSRLGTEIRDRQGLTYGIYSTFQTGRYPGPFLIQMQTAPEDTQRAIARTIALLQQVRQEGLTEAEVETAKASISSSYAVALANPDAVANRILMNQVHGLSPEEIRTFPDKIRAVTPEQVNQAAQELLHPNNLIVVTAGPPVSAQR